MRFRDRISKPLSIILVLAMVLSLMPGGVFVYEAKADTTELFSDYTKFISDPLYQYADDTSTVFSSDGSTNENYGTTSASSGTVSVESWNSGTTSGGQGSPGGQPGGTTTYTTRTILYYQTLSTAGAGEYTLTAYVSSIYNAYNVAPTVTVYPYVNGSQVTGTYSQLSSSTYGQNEVASQDSSGVFTYTFTLDEEQTDYVVGYYITVYGNTEATISGISLTYEAASVTVPDDATDLGTTEIGDTTYNVYSDSVDDEYISVGDTVPTLASTITVYAVNASDDTDVTSETVDVTWDYGSLTSGSTADSAGKYEVTGTFTYNNTLYTITAYIYVSRAATIIDGTNEGDFEDVTEESGTYTTYTLNDWILTADDWDNATEFSAGTEVWYTFLSNDYTLQASWYHVSAYGDCYYAIYDEYERYLAPGEYTLTFNAVGTGVSIGAYFDGKKYDAVAVSTSTINESDYTAYTVTFTVEEPILQTLVGVYIECTDNSGSSTDAWVNIDSVNIDGYQFDETSDSEIAEFESLYLETYGYDYFDLETDADDNLSTENSTAYNYVFNAENALLSSSLYNDSGFFNDSSEVYLDWSTGSSWWSSSLTTSNNYAENVPEDWQNTDGQMETWVSDTSESTDAITYTVPILPAGTYTLYYSVMGKDGTVSPYIGSNAVTDANHGLVYWDRYQYYSYTFTVAETQFDYKIGLYYSLEAGGYAYTDDVYLLSLEEITETELEAYDAYKQSKLATNVTYDSGTIDEYNYESVADAGTFNLNQYFGTSDDDGKILTDKSVTLAEVDFEEDGTIDIAEPDDTNFTVALSALGQTYTSEQVDVTFTGGSTTETGAVDVVFVLDTSMSMFVDSGDYAYEEKLISMIDAVNQAIDTILEANSDNRIAVVAFSSNSDTETLISLTSNPTALSSGEYDNLDSTDSDGNAITPYIGYDLYYTGTVKDDYFYLGSAEVDRYAMDTFGTFTQKGISYAGDILDDAELTSTGDSRTPYIFLLSDGEADYYNTSYTSIPITSATNSSASYTATTGYYTILTANYVKDLISEHYTTLNGADTEAYFHTVAFNIDDSDYYDYAVGVLNPSSLASSTDSVATSLLEMLEVSEYADDYDYVTEYSEALDAAELEEIISTFATTVGTLEVSRTSIVETPANTNHTDLTSEVEFTDYIGDQMQIVGNPLISYQGVLYGVGVADGDTSYPVTSESGTDDDGNACTITTYKYYAEVNPYSADTSETVADYLGTGTTETFNLEDITVKVYTYSDGSQMVKFIIPNDLLPVIYHDPDTDTYSTSYPIRLVYTVGLVVDSNLQTDTSYYTNKYYEDGEGVLQAETTAVFEAAINNPYYYTVTDWMESDVYITEDPIDYDDVSGTYTAETLALQISTGETYESYTTKKYSNATKTAAYSYSDSEDYTNTLTVSGYNGLSAATTDVNYLEITTLLGNNGKISLTAATSLEYFVWRGHEATLDVGANIDTNVSDYLAATVSLESTLTGTDSYTATFEGDAEELVLTFTSNNDVGDYTYTLESGETSSTATVTIHVYDVDDDVYVLDYGLGVSLADTTYDNGMFQGDTLVTNDTDMSAYYEGISVATDSSGLNALGEEEEYDYGVSVDGVQGTVTSSASELEIDTDTLALADTDYDIVYTPTQFMSSIDYFEYQVITRLSTSTALNEYNNGVTMHANIKIMPAESVYYEDNFASSSQTNTDATTGFIYNGTISVTTGEETLQSNSLLTQYGYDTVYSDDTTYSNGSVTRMTAGDATSATTATFQFDGTGFAVYARCSSNTATFFAVVKDENGAYVTGQLVNTFYQNGTLYQIPVISITDLDYDTYTVTLYALAEEDQTRVYLDGIRIYNPLGTTSSNSAGYATATASEGYLANEVDAAYSEVRELILGEGYTTTFTTDGDDTTYTVTAGSGVAAALVTYDDSSTVTVGFGGTTTVETFTDISAGTTSDAQSVSDYYTYLVSGPNNETYLAKNNAVAITLEGYDSADDTYTFQVGAKSVSGSAELTAVVLNYDDGGTYTVASTAETTVIETATEMYYVVTMPSSITDNCMVILMNTGDSDSVLSLTDIKTNGYEYLTADNEYGEEWGTTLAYTIANYLSDLTSSGDDSSDDYSESDSGEAETDNAELVNSVLAQTSSVSDSKYSLRFIGVIGEDDLDLDTVGFLITIYDEDGNVYSAESLKKITTVYTSITANTVKYYADAQCKDDDGNYVTTDADNQNGYIYTYTFKNIPTSSTYYFRVANYTSGCGTEDSDEDGVIDAVTSTSSYKYYKVVADESSVTLTTVTTIPDGGDE